MKILRLAQNDSNNNMRIGIYDPYLDTLGGGERFVLSMASYLSKLHNVEIFWNDKSILDIAEKKHDLDLNKVVVADNIFSNKYSSLGRIMQSARYDVIFYMSDGSIPFLFSKKNYLIFQFPVNWVNGKSLRNRIKLAKLKGVICYTKFVKDYLAPKFKLPIHVLYPPVDAIKSDPKEKENIILTVGRFTKGMNRKKHEIMVDSFKKLIDQGLTDWKLVIAGSYLPDDHDLVKDLKRSAAGFPIEIYENAKRLELEDFYKKAKIYWHAAGFGEDLNEHPEFAEHFGITTVEAMGAAAVPVVIKAGGQIEIVEDKISGFLWNDLDELGKLTYKLVNDKKLWERMSQNAQKRAKFFSKENFYQKIEELIK